MQGKFIQGFDLQGKECEGVVLDSCIVPQTIQFAVPPPPGAISRTQVQQLPMALTAYLIRNESTGTVHLVSPGTITVVDEWDVNQIDKLTLAK